MPGDLVISGARKLLKLESRKSIDIDLSDVSRGGKIDIFRHVEDRGLLFLQFRRSKVVVSAGPYIGLIPLTPQITVEVKPKLPVSNLSRVLEVSQRSLSLLSGTERLYTSEGMANPSIIEFLALNLQEAVQPVIQMGFFKTYQKRSELGSEPRGRINVAGTMRAWGRGQHHRVEYSKFEQLSDTSENRVLRAGLRVAAERMPSDTQARKHLVRALNSSLCEFPSSISAVRSRDLSLAKQAVRYHDIPENRHYYYRALGIALRLLENDGISLDRTDGDVSLTSFILNFEELFEDYLRKVLQISAPNGTVVRDGNKEGRRHLFDERRGQLAQPDIVILSGPERRVLIGEVKYKEKPNRDDINQAITYANVYRTKLVVLVHQCASMSKAGLYTMGTIDGITLFAFGYDLGSSNLMEEEKKFSSTIFGLAGAKQPVQFVAA